MAKDESTKKVQTYYLKKANIDWLNQQAFGQSTADERVTDDALLDAILDKARESGQSPTQSKSIKKNTAQAVSAPLAA